VVEIMRKKLQELKHEECWAIFLSNSNRILDTYRISQGGIQATVVDQRIIVRRALELLSTRIILIHNHPSGSATPSNADITLTHRVTEATSLFDIQLLDHIIISSTGSYYSFKQEGRL
jgi:DNA repair protein RadC